MPLTIKQNGFKFKDSNDDYVGVDVIAETTLTEQIAAVEGEGATQVAAVQAKGTQVINSIPSDYTELTEEVDSLKSALNHVAWYSESVPYTSGGYILNNQSVGSTVDVSSITSSTNYGYAVFPVRKGDQIKITASGGSNPRAWAFTDNDYKMLSKAAANVSVSATTLTASVDGYFISDALLAYTHTITHYFYYEDVGTKIESLKADVTILKNGAIAEPLAFTSLAKRYFDSDGTPTESSSDNWQMYIANVEGLEAIHLKTYKVSSSNLMMWSFSSVAYASATTTTLNDATKVVQKGTTTTDTEEIEAYLEIPTGAKTLMVTCAAAYISSYPVLYKYTFNEFYFLKDVPDFLDDVNKLNAKTNGFQAYQGSPYFRKVRWGANAFNSYYHSEDDGTSLFPSTTTAAQFFNACNTLVSSYSGYAESHEMGVASDETTTMYYYTFNPKTNQDGTGYNRPKIIIGAGQHGFEKTANFGLYWFMKNLLEDWENNDFLAYVRNHVQLVIMPMLNPYGFDHDNYLNANGVNLNRNWGTTGWTQGESGTTTYGGTEPFSEVETQYARDVILANLDALWVCDYHNNGQIAPTAATGYLWHSFALVTYDDEYFTKAIDAAKWHIDETTGHLYVDYPEVCEYVNSGTFTDNNAPSHQGLMVAYAREQGIMAATMEGGAAFIDSGSRFTSPIHHMNADLIGNWIRCLLGTYSRFVY